MARETFQCLGVSATFTSRISDGTNYRLSAGGRLQGRGGSVPASIKCLPLGPSPVASFPASGKELWIYEPMAFS